MVCKVHKYADGGKVVKDHTKKNPLKPPQKGGTPQRITTPGKPGDSGPGGAHPGRNRPKKMADGGKVAKKGKKKPKPKPEMLGTGMAARGAQSILDARKRREKEAGL